MTSRLDRLFLLLETGSTPLTRKAAALQLGEVQKLHPHELKNLLVKVRQYLHSSSWDTRIAASQAVEAIVSNVPLWFPPGLPDVDVEVKSEPTEDDSCYQTTRYSNLVAGRMMFDNYDVHTVIKCGHNLLASEGKEFDDPDESISLNSLDAKEKIARQRQLLNERLGLSIAEKFGVQLDFISNTDLESNNGGATVGHNATSTATPMNEAKLNEILTKATGRSLPKTQRSLPVGGSSSINNNNNVNHSLKRMNSNDSLSEDASKKVKTEPSDDNGGDSSESSSTTSATDLETNEWPLEWFSDELMGDLFNPMWEIRHGAATGLREIVRLQGRCGGRHKAAPASQMNTLNQQWLEDLSLRLLSVLALDRFGDFLSDQVVAPVRETCAQVLGLVIKLLSVDGVNNVLRILLQLLRCSEWEARHGGMLGLKYLLAIRQDMIDKLLPEVFEPVFNGLKDSVDDVSAVAAAALVPVKNQLMSLIPEKVPLVIAFLWEALLELDDLSSSTGDLLMLLSSLLTFKGLEMKHNLLAYEDKELVTLIPRLWPFLSHSLSSVRKSVLDSLLILCEKSSDDWLTPSLLSDALRLLYQRSLIENIDSILEMLYKVWLALVCKAKYHQLIEATCSYVTGWICLMMHPHKIAIDPSNSPVWLDVKHIIASQHSKNRHGFHQELSSASLQSEQYYIGGAESLSEAAEEREKCVIRARYQCARLIGTLAYVLTEPCMGTTEASQNGNNSKEEGTTPSPLPPIPNPLESFANILLYHLNTKSAIQRMCTAWIIKEWAIVTKERRGEQQPPWIVEKLEPKTDPAAPVSVQPKLQLYKSLSDRCFELLQEPIYFDELQNQFARLQLYTRDFLNFLRQNKVTFDDSVYSATNVYTFVQINALVSDISDNSLKELKQQYNSSKKPTKKLKTTIDTLEERVAFLRRSVVDIQTYSNSLSVGVNSALASALITWHFLPEKLNPIIRPIMDSIKAEENEQLQRGSASSLVQLLRLCCERIYLDSSLPTPLPKIIKNLITYLCSDRNFTPEISLLIAATSEQVEENESTNNRNNSKKNLNSKKQVQLGILTLDNMQKYAEKSSSFRRSNSMSVKAQKSVDESNSANTQSTNGACSSSSISNSNSTNAQATSANSNPSSETMDKQNEILRRGATITLSESCRYFGEYLPDRLPTLWEHILHLSNSKSLPQFDEQGLESARHLIQCLQVFEVIGPHLQTNLRSSLTAAFDFLCMCLESPYITIRHMASRCFGMLSTILPSQTMDVILTKALDLLDATECELKRQGAVEAICCVIERLSLKIVPYIVLLIVPMLGRMSDQNESVRLLATHCFAQLVQLMPLDNDNQNKLQANVPELNGTDLIEPKKEETEVVVEKSSNGFSTKVEFSEELLKRKENERHFLEQLMNIKKIDDYKLPIPVEAELRTYQQDGLNWLAFLNKYKLHGIVADEMGLGKTLQAICILASDHHYMLNRYLNGESNNRPLPSIVICPPTLTGHWIYEVDKFVSAKYLCPIHYTGPPFERTKLKNKIKKALQTPPKAVTEKGKNYNLIIASYDLVRNDIDFFSAIKWNYCILDEGHVIKNGKTKLAKAIKSLTANHRLILTGTPIQNNVLELWSLFDFLMPGFLGTERQFMARYSKPILASRDAKSSSKEQEAGILAMEGLHRQVLPFILRRMKEDVLKDLPPKIIQDYYCELSPLQAQLYEDFYKSRARQSLKQAIDSEVDEIASSANKAMADNNNSGNKNPNKSHIFQSLQYLRKVCNHPKLVLSASHPHYQTIMDKLKAENNSLNDINNAAKLCALKQLLLDCGIGTMGNSNGGQAVPVVNQHRALVFCQLKSMLDIVENDLLKVHMRSVSYLRLDGDVPANSRYSVIHRFNNDPSIDILLLTTQVGGLGLNLTGADTVIFVEHDWNPMKDLQAMDRAHRIGQKKVVNVYRLITTGTLEEKIMGLQKFKLTIANTVISSENSSLESMATDQLLDLFELSSSEKESGKSSALSLSSGSSSGGIGSGKQPVSMKMVLDNLPELWDVQQYEDEYDLNNFLSTLQSSSSSNC